MQRHPNKSEQCELDTNGYNLHFGSQGWNYGIGNNIMPANAESRSALTDGASSNQLLSQTRPNCAMPGSGIRQEHEHVPSLVLPPNTDLYVLHEDKRNQIGSSKVSAYSYLEPIFRDSTQAHDPLKLPYLHESRHLHALRRAQGCGGRFVNTKKSENSTHGEGRSAGDSPPLPSPDSDHASLEPSRLNQYPRLSIRETDGEKFF